MNKTFCIIFLLICFAQAVSAQSSKVFVRILDYTYNPVPSASVKVLENNQEQITDQNGRIELEFSEFKAYTLVIHANDETYEEKLSFNGLKQYTIYIGDKHHFLAEIMVNAAMKFAQKRTTTVGKIEQENLETSQTYNIIPSELIKERSVTDMKGALLAAPGIANVTNGLGAGGFTVIARMRGFSTGTGSLRNGYRTSTTTMADLANIEAIEVIKGPAGTLFGSSSEISYGGMINLVTKKPQPYTFGEVSLSYGGFDLSRLTLDFNTPVNDSKTVLFRVNGAFQRGKTFQDFGLDNTTFIAPAFRFLVNDRLTLNIEAEISQSERNMIAVGYLPKGFNSLKDFDWNIKKSFSSNNLTMKSNVLNMLATADYKVSENWHSQTIVSSANTVNKSDYLFVVPLTKDTVGRRIMRIPSNFISSSLQQNFIGTYSGENWVNKLLVGIDYNNDQYLTTRKMQSFYDKVNRFATAPTINMSKLETMFAAAPESEINTKFQTYGIYLSNVFSLHKRLHLNAGLRMDQYRNLVSDFEETYFSPKFGAVYEVVSDQVSLFGNYTNGFNNGYLMVESVQFNAASIKPQEANQYEFGLKYELFNKKLHGNASYYNIDVINVPFSVVAENGKTSTVQNGKRLSRGFEFDVTANPFPGLHFILGYGYNDSKFTEGDQTTIGNRPQGTPFHVGNFWTSYSMQSGSLKGVGIGIGGNYSDDFYGDDFNTFKMPGYFLLDANIYYERDQFRVSLKGNNLTDVHYMTTNFWLYAQPTRTILGTVSYRF